MPQSFLSVPGCTITLMAGFVLASTGFPLSRE